MIATTLVLVGIFLLLTTWITIRVRGRTVKAVWVVPLWGGGACLVLLSVAGVYYVNATRTYDKCVDTAERSIGSREQTLQFYDTIDVLAKSQHFTSDPILPDKPSLRMALDINLPVLNPKNCEAP